MNPSQTSLFRKLVVISWIMCVATIAIIMPIHMDRLAPRLWLELPQHIVKVASICVSFIGACWSMYFLVFRRDDEAMVFGFLAASLGMAIAFLSPIWGLVFLATVIWLRLKILIEKKTSEPGATENPML